MAAADYVLILDLVESGDADIRRRLDSKHRSDCQVFAYRLVAQGTVEEKVAELQRTKRDLAEAIIWATAWSPALLDGREPGEAVV